MVDDRLELIRNKPLRRLHAADLRYLLSKIDELQLRLDIKNERAQVLKDLDSALMLNGVKYRDVSLEELIENYRPRPT